MAAISIHAGHNPAGKVACGTVGLLDESKENRLIVAEMIDILKSNGWTVYNDTVDNGSNQNDVLNKIVTKCNSHSVSFVFSIHLNSGRNDYPGDSRIGGFEVWDKCHEQRKARRQSGSAPTCEVWALRTVAQRSAKISKC